LDTVVVAERKTSLLRKVLKQLQASPVLLCVAAGLILFMTLVVFALSDEPYVATAVVAPRAAEARGIELGSLASLTELAGGGRRPIFEEFIYLISSEASARRLLEEKNPGVKALLKQASTLSSIRRAYYAVQNLARKLVGRDARRPSAFEDTVRRVRKSIETRKTPEGYVAITVSASNAEEAKLLLDGLVKASDEMIRIRERAIYSERVSVLLTMSEKSVRPNERIAISNAIDRDFARYVNSLGSDAFAYQYVVLPRVESQPRYANLVLVFIACAFVVTFALVVFVTLRVRLSG
jgi:hypothetical protein